MLTIREAGPDQGREPQQDDEQLEGPAPAIRGIAHRVDGMTMPEGPGGTVGPVASPARERRRKFRAPTRI